MFTETCDRQAAGCIIISCWILGALIGFLPLFGWNNGPSKSGLCLFIPVMNYDFLVFVFFATIVFPAALMAFCYLRIYLIVVRQRDLSLDDSLTKTDSENRDSSSTSPDETLKLNWSRKSSSAENTLNIKITKTKKVSYSRREVKKARKLAIIMIFFIICWIPLYLVNTLQAFCKHCKVPLWLLDAFIIISHINSAVNPILYAYHMKDFRVAMHRVLCKCVLRQQGLRDIRRQELMSITALQWRQKQKANVINDSIDFATSNGQPANDVRKQSLTET
ncbi:adenosine receptor A2b-like protein [Leptotrombidium deliense]|uniref:Adenosine receptor A2b-like protein n=1 Tax=Leptotrombidium deliense TaxID=299467 RepID=A0A443SLM7_9ACAR|nr:adenosine receptor A2b-like protein [Leptotrombidium deliense]